jgi:hypothetical protein
VEVIMSEAATAQFDASVAPLANMSILGQIGPNIAGSGTATFSVTAPVFQLFFSPAGASQAAYGMNGHAPTTPLKPGVWTPIQGATSVSVRYAAPANSDLKLVWAQ